MTTTPNAGLGGASLALMGIGAVGSAIGTYQQAKSAKSQLRYQAAIAEINRRMSESSAQQAMQQGQQQVAATTMKYGAVKSSQRAAMAANGVDLGTGNAAEVQASTDILKDIDKQTIEANAIRAAFGYRTQGANYGAQAGMANASASGISPVSAGFSTLLGSASKVAGSWYGLSKVGALDNGGTTGQIGGSGMSMNAAGETGLSIGAGSQGLKFNGWT